MPVKYDDDNTLDDGPQASDFSLPQAIFDDQTEEEHVRKANLKAGNADNIDADSNSLPNNVASHVNSEKLSTKSPLASTAS